MLNEKYDAGSHDVVTGSLEGRSLLLLLLLALPELVLPLLSLLLPLLLLLLPVVESALLPDPPTG